MIPAWLVTGVKWLGFALAVLLTGGWALRERRRRIAADARADFAEGAGTRARELAVDITEIERRATGARIAISTETERAAAPHEAAAQASAQVAASIRTVPDPSAELLSEIARRNNVHLVATRNAAARLVRPDPAMCPDCGEKGTADQPAGLLRPCPGCGIMRPLQPPPW